MHLTLHDKFAFIHHHRLFFILLFLYIAAVGILISLYQGDLKIKSSEAALPASIYSQKQNYEVITNWHLFGVNTDAALNKVKDSKIKLVGIIYHTDHTKRNAIILIDNKEFVLHYGDKIGNDYTIHKIEPSRIIVSSENGLEEIPLFAK